MYLLRKSIKSFAKHAGYVGLADKGVGIDVAYDTHYLLCLVATRQHTYYVHRLLGVPACAVQNSYSAVDGVIDSCGNLGIMVL